MTIGQALRRRRKRLGLSIWGLEKECGVSHETILRMEHDKSVTLDSLKKVATCLGYVVKVGVEKVE